MALPDRNPSAGAALAITCVDYAPGERRRCKHFQSGGTCAHPDRFLCEEWERANQLRLLRMASRDDARPSSPPPALPGIPTPHLPAPAPAPAPAAPTPAASPAPKPDAAPLRGLTSADIDAFKAIGLEVRLQHDALGELFLVPETTGQPRHELTPEQAATVLRVMSLFPGARIVELRPAPTRAPRAPEPSPMSE